MAGSLPQETGTLANIVKTDGNGKVEWNKTYPSAIPTGWSYAYSIVEREGGYAVVRVKKNAGLSLLDASGNVESEKTYPSAGYFQSIITSGSGYIIAGSAPENNTGSPLGLGLLQKVDAAGNVVWSKKFNDPDNHDSQQSQFRAVAGTADGGYVASADTSSSVDADGNLLCYFSIESGVTNQFGSMNAVAASLDGGFVITGSKNSSVWLAKFPVDPQSSVSNASSSNGENGIFLAASVVAIVALVVAVLVLLFYVQRLKNQLKTDKAPPPEHL